MDDNTMKPWPGDKATNGVRSTVAASKKAAWVIGGSSLTVSATTILLLGHFFYGKDEGLALATNVQKIERNQAEYAKARDEKMEQSEFKIINQVAENQKEITRVLERKVDKILEFIKDGEKRAERIDDRQDRQIENLELYVLGKPKQRGKNESTTR